MIITESHDHLSCDKMFLQMVTNDSTNVARGESLIWDSSATGLARGVYCKRSPASASAQNVCGVAEDDATALDLTRVMLVQRAGFHDAVLFTANPPALDRRFGTGATAGKATCWAAATPADATQGSASYGIAVQTGATTAAAILDCHL
jgi:hypothetical protein